MKQNELDFAEGRRLGKQCQDVLEVLTSGRDITPLYAFRYLGIERLAARIHDLKKAGYSIDRSMVAVTKADGSSATVASYRLA